MSNRQPTATGHRSFAFLNMTMFQGAFSDNVYKALVTFLAIAAAREQFGYGTPGFDSVAYEKHSAMMTGIAGALFILPYVIVPTFAGSLADKFSKARITFYTKVMEVVVMMLALGAFLAGSVWGSFFILSLMGMQSALFSPSKYGILPELVEREKSAWANGVLQMWTFLAIIAGTIAGPALFQFFQDQLWIPGVLLVVLALVGAWTSNQIERTPAASPDLRISINPIPEVRRNLREIHAHPGLTMTVGGLTIWWLVAVMLQQAAVLMGTNTLKLDYLYTGLAMLPISLGIGIGCYLAGRVSKGRIEMGLVPVGALGMFAGSLFVFLVGSVETPNPYLVSLGMGLVGFFAGFFSVPLQAYLIETPRDDVRGGIWAAQNFITAFGMITGSLMMGKLGGLGYSPADIFLVGGLLMLVVCVFVCVRMPDVPLRFFVLTLFSALYRVRSAGVDRIPREGGALLVSNHQSFLDAVVLTASCPRRIRFIMSREYFNKPLIYPFAKLSNSIPIETNMSPREIIAAFREAAEAIKQGELVCIFAEGALTRHGHLLPFRRGFEKIMKDVDAPIVPVALDGLWDTAWSMRPGRAKGPRFRLTRRALNVAFGNPIPGNSPCYVVRQQVIELMVEAFNLRRESALPLHRMAIVRMRRRPFEPAFADTKQEALIPRWKFLTASIVLARRLREYWQGQEFVGIMMPPSIACAALNLGALVAGKVPVNLNYTMSPEILQKIVQKTDLRLLVTSREFVDKLAERVDLRPHLKEGGMLSQLRVVYLEDERKRISGADRIRAMVESFVSPCWLLERSLGATRKAGLDDPATIIFSSGSTGDPKGVVLTHWNIKSNVLGTAQAAPFSEGDAMIGILPFFHSFGFMATMWLAIEAGIRVIYFPNPLDARVIGALVQKYRITHLVATPTFLSGYVRRVEPAQFGSLKFVLTGAEKLRSALAEEFHQRFGIRPVEGYGATETSPVVALSTLSVRMPGIYQIGNRPGYIGHPIPGVAVRIVDPETMVPLPPGEPGMLLAKGPNIMQMYYGAPDKYAEVVKDGWYVSGDIAKMEEDGFIQITDRLSRFSKIGGEMVPHVRVEEALNEFSTTGEMQFAVTGIPDERKGERLVVLYTAPEEVAREAAEALSNRGMLPNLWIPKFSDFFPIKSIPVLGTGKTDLRALKETAVRMAKEPVASGRNKEV